MLNFVIKSGEITLISEAGEPPQLIFLKTGLSIKNVSLHLHWMVKGMVYEEKEMAMGSN